MFYVYILQDPITNEPFYVGVGKQNRKALCPREDSHKKEAIRFRKGGKIPNSNKHKIYKILKILDNNLDIKINITKYFDNEQDAFIEETRLIKLYGRADLKLGPLTNLTNGGEGVVNMSVESREKISKALKGKPSHAKGKILGPYSEGRKKNQKEKMLLKKQQLNDNEKEKQYLNRSNAQKGKIPWNKGKTKETSISVALYASAKTGKPRPDMIGKEPWNKGKKCPELGLHHKGKPAHNKGIPSGKKGMTYEEIYGPEKAKELRELRKKKRRRNPKIVL